jgi:hypothetical protein
MAQQEAIDGDRVVQLLQEAQLFIDAARDCHNRVRVAAQSAALVQSAQPGT